MQTVPTGDGERVWLLVLGDFGRSPRMQYHALSLADAGYAVSVVSLPGGSQPIEDLRDRVGVDLYELRAPPAWLASLPTLLALAAKAAWQLACLLWLMLVSLPRPRLILMQNPPAIPSMLVCWLAAKRHSAAWVIDWHNLAFSIMQLKYARHARLLILAKAWERRLGARADAHLCVTQAMAAFLAAEFGLPGATVLYDRPAAAFRPASVAEQHKLFWKLAPLLAKQALGGALAAQLAAAQAERAPATLMTVVDPDTLLSEPLPRRGRPALVVSSTSWTQDEDFGLLLEAAQAYDAAASAGASSGGSGGGDVGSAGDAAGCSKPSGAGDAAGSTLPDVVFLITGRGPQQEEYLERIKGLDLKRVGFASVWLRTEDYPTCLGSADLGVCLHTSSSGLDLPMKVVDMFGAGLPVCAAKFACIEELVAPGRTGLLFSSAAELAAQLQELLAGFDGTRPPAGRLAAFRAGVAAEQAGRRWHDNWDAIAAPLIARLVGGDRGPARQAGAARESKDKAA